MKKSIIKINNKQETKNRKIKVYFIIINLIISTIAFSILINAQTTPSPPATPGVVNPPSTTPTPGTGGGLQRITPGVTNINTGQNTPPGITNTPPGGTNTATPGSGGGEIGEGGTGGGITTVFGGISFNLQSIITKGTLGAGIFGTIGALAGGDNGALWGAVAGAVGGAVAAVTTKMLGEFWSTILGLTVATLIFIFTYVKKTTGIVEFYCLPWEAPIGGDNCAVCNNFKECSEYTCKSLGQACEIANPGTPEQKCYWKNPADVNSPKISMINVTKDHVYIPDNNVRPPATGVKIKPKNAECLKAFTPLSFSFKTDEPSQCKIDYNLSSDPKTAFDEMAYYVGGNSLFVENHSEKLSLPGPDALNAIAPQLKNNGKYTLFVRCRDANGNFNQDAYSISFCVEPGPDTTPPNIVSANIPGGRPVQFNQTKVNLEIYVNEPAECRWSRTDQKYELMENNMSCDTNVWEMNNNLVYTCKTVLTGIQNRKENEYFFRCKDQPWKEEGDRNTNKQSFAYKIIGTQPLNIMEINPNETISGSTDTIPVFLNVRTDNGYNNGDSLCYYSQGKPAKEEDYILFMETGGNNHTQRQDLLSKTYTYYIKCVDLGGNSAYNITSFSVESDKQAPWIVRVYRDSGELKIITSEDGICTYSVKDCNFEIDSGIKMSSVKGGVYTAVWTINQNYYIRCKDKYDNQPNPNTCTIILRPSKINTKSEVIEF